MALEIKGNVDNVERESLSVVSGDDKTIKVTVEDKDGSAVDISGATINYSVFSDGSEDFGKSDGSGISITDAANGVFEISINSSDTNSLEDRLKHECEIDVSPYGTSTIFKGNLKIEGDFI